MFSSCALTCLAENLSWITPWRLDFCNVPIFSSCAWAQKKILKVPNALIKPRTGKMSQCSSQEVIVPLIYDVLA